jgi:hypothetical protein
MNVHVNAARKDQATRRINDLGASRRRAGQSRADRRDLFALDSHVGSILTIFSNHRAVRDDDVVSHECGFSASHDVVRINRSIARPVTPILFVWIRSVRQHTVENS